ncbi:hypothetical protein Gotur_012474, partial [Gossypium turneri]
MNSSELEDTFLKGKVLSIRYITTLDGMNLRSGFCAHKTQLLPLKQDNNVGTKSVMNATPKGDNFGLAKEGMTPQDNLISQFSPEKNKENWKFHKFHSGAAKEFRKSFKFSIGKPKRHHGEEDCVDWIEDTTRLLDNVALSKNNKVFRNTEDELKVIWDRAATLNRDFCIFNFVENPLVPKSVGEKGWQKPGTGVVKINVDATVDGKRMSFGVVARDHKVFELGGRAGVMDNQAGAEWAELLALTEGLELAREKRWLKLKLETDC